jgi:hypothetical protein
MNQLFQAAACAILLSACQSGSGKPTALGANALACREAATVETLRAAGERFQRVADAELASGRCRIFQAADLVSDRRVEKGMTRFTDAASGRVFWAYSPG